MSTNENGNDREKQLDIVVPEPPDIEHVNVQDDPRAWSANRKTIILLIISAATWISALSVNMQNPANQNIEDELHTSPSEISWSISGFILAQGTFPLLWSAVSEIKGRKMVYLISFGMFVAGSVAAAVSTSIGLLISMRVLQGAGSAAVYTIGASTLADIFEPAERGSKIGFFYAVPFFGPSLGVVLGGALTQGFSWRAVFWFLTSVAGLIFILFLVVFKDTFRRERSSTYQIILEKRRQERDQKQSQQNVMEASAEIPTRGHTDSNIPSPNPVSLEQIKLSFTDINPFSPLLRILQRPNNLAILLPSALFFAFANNIKYTCALTLSDKYKYNALQTGLVLLAFGAGGMAGSILGGRWSDRTLARLTAKNGGKSYPEMRLESTKLAMLFLPLSVLGYAWVCEKQVHVSAVCVMLFLSSFFLVWTYSSTLAYIVDANVGRSSTAVAANSVARGLSAFLAAEAAVPLQDALGDGGAYTMWAGLMVIAEIFILLVLYKGGRWRERREAKEALKVGG